MKIKYPLVAALLIGMQAVSSAFTLDIATYQGPLSSTPASINVPFYGEVSFEWGAGSNLVINSDYQNDNGFGGPSLNFDNGESLKVTFNGAAPLNVNFDFVGVSVGEYFAVSTDLINPQAYNITFNGAGDGAGLYAVSWNTVPEPTSAMLGLLGGAFFAFRRRR